MRRLILIMESYPVLSSDFGFRWSGLLLRSITPHLIAMAFDAVHH